MRVLCVWGMVCLIWSTSWIAVKIGLRDLPPLSFAGFRFVLASTILLGVCVGRRVPLPRARRDWLLLAGTGVLFFSINYGLVFWGQQYISAGVAAVLQAMIPAFGLVLAHVYLPQERITLFKGAAVVLGIVGVAVIFADQLRLAGLQALWGSVALVLSAGIVAYTNVLVKAYGSHLSSLTITTGQMVCGMLPLVLVSFRYEGNPLFFAWSGWAVAALLYLALLGSVVALLSYYWLLKHMEVTKVMLYALVTPPLTVLLDALLLGGRIGWQTVAGASCILVSVGLILTRRSGVVPAAHSAAAAPPTQRM